MARPLIDDDGCGRWARRSPFHIRLRHAELVTASQRQQPDRRMVSANRSGAPRCARCGSRARRKHKHTERYGCACVCGWRGIRDAGRTAGARRSATERRDRPGTLRGPPLLSVLCDLRRGVVASWRRVVVSAAPAAVDSEGSAAVTGARLGTTAAGMRSETAAELEKRASPSRSALDSAGTRRRRRTTTCVSPRRRSGR
jgi:hypothetical protein